MLAITGMMDQANASGTLALDARGLDELRRHASQNSPEGLKAAAKQFEAIFLNMMLKSMRAATPEDGLMDSDQSRMYVSILDQQLSQSMASKGIGLADVLIRQLSSFVGSRSAASKDSQDAVPPVASNVSGNAEVSRTSTTQDFQTRLAPHAEEASRATGIPAGFMIGHAALETGWGKREIIGADGVNSHNLFGIKATSAWKGRVVESVTGEYVNGVMQKLVQKFRAYDSYADAFKDYANVLITNPRYQHVFASSQDAAGFAQGLQRAGYATDPRYADKLTRVIKRVTTS
jgi:flagellar protein FlgJ